MSDDLSKTTTEPAPFDPTPGMRIWLDTAIELQSDNISEIAEKCSMARSTWYEWLKIPQFEDWFFEQYKKKRRRWLPTLDKMGMQNAKRDYNYWKDMRKAAGEDSDKPNVAVQINNFVKQEKDEFGI
jgi:hypothetical protein